MKDRSVFGGSLRLFALPAIAVLLLGACAGTNQPAGTQPGPGASLASPAAVKPQVPKLVPTQPPSDLGAVERFAWQQVVQLGEAFAAGDVEGFLAKVSRGFYRSYSTLEKSLTTLLTPSSARDAVVAVRSVTEEEGRVNVKAEWTRTVTLPDGSVDARRGETVFLFLRSDTSLRLLDYRGDPPFAIDGI
jgi:hypothetical protein